MAMNHKQGGAESASEERRQSPADLVHRAAEGAHDTIDRLEAQAAPAAEKLRDQLDTTGEMLHARADQMRQMGREWRDGVRSSVREHPLTTIAAALALGVLLARLSR